MKSFLCFCAGLLIGIFAVIYIKSEVRDSAYAMRSQHVLHTTITVGYSTEEPNCIYLFFLDTIVVNVYDKEKYEKFVEEIKKLIHTHAMDGLLVPPASN